MVRRLSDSIDVDRVDSGRYIIQEGDDVQHIAMKVYGDNLKYQTLLKANPLCTWEPGKLVEVPNVPGRITRVLPEDTLRTITERMFPGQMYQLYFAPFTIWNGELEDLPVGTLVFVPERQYSSY